MTASSNDFPLDSVINVRDVGGIKTESGQAVKTGRLLRGALPDSITPEDLSVLVERHGVTEFLDLRSPNLFAEAGNSEIVRRGITRINTLIGDTDRSNNAEEFAIDRMAAGIRADFHDGYVRMLGLRDRYSDALAAIASNTQSGTFVHCTAGKDRTGVLIAMALSAVGAHRSDVVSDYAATGLVRDDIIEKVFGTSPRFRSIRDSLDPEVVHSWAAAPAETMERVLDTVDKTYGSPRSYVLDLPNGAEIIENLERKLLGT